VLNVFEAREGRKGVERKSREKKKKMTGTGEVTRKPDDIGRSAMSRT